MLLLLLLRIIIVIIIIVGSSIDLFDWRLSILWALLIDFPSDIDLRKAPPMQCLPLSLSLFREYVLGSFSSRVTRRFSRVFRSYLASPRGEQLIASSYSRAKKAEKYSSKTTFCGISFPFPPSSLEAKETRKELYCARIRTAYLVSNFFSSNENPVCRETPLPTNDNYIQT